jgi:hypothetical protein
MRVRDGSPSLTPPIMNNEINFNNVIELGFFLLAVTTFAITALKLLNIVL